MKQIYYDCGISHLLFIRYNPDDYKATGINKLDNKKREEYLIKVINRYFEEIPKYNLSVLYLFYDDFTLDTELEQISVI